jgi:peptidoglycan/LPS O-acetylase OafA/YrhL
VHGATGDIAGGSWSISTEFFLYLIFIPAAAVLARLRQPRKWLVGLCIFAPIAIFAISRLVPDTPATLPQITAPLRYWFLYFSPFVRAFEFFAGALAAQILVVPDRRVADGLSRAAWIISACVAWCLLVILLAPYIKNDVVASLLPNFIFTPAIVIVLVTVCTHDTFWSRLASSRLAIGAGEISYSVYLLQTLVFVALAHSFVESSGLSKLSRTVYVIAITTALGYGVYHLFEAPMRGWIRNFSSRQQVKYGSA